MPEIQLLPSPRVNPYAGQDAKAVMDILNILGSAEVARRNKIITQNILEAVAGRAGPEGIASAALIKPEFSTGIPGFLQRFASPFAEMTPGIEDIIAGRAVESAFDPLMPLRIEAEKARLAYWKRPVSKKAQKTFSPAQMKSYGEAMDSEIEKVGKSRWGYNYTKKDLLSAWENFKRVSGWDALEEEDISKDQLTQLWINKLKAKGGQAEFDINDPDWIAELGLSNRINQPTRKPSDELRKARETGAPLLPPGLTGGGYGPRIEIKKDSAKMQSAPDMKLDQYWTGFDDELKKQIWTAYEQGIDIDDIISDLRVDGLLK